MISITLILIGIGTILIWLFCQRLASTPHKYNVFRHSVSIFAGIVLFVAILIDGVNLTTIINGFALSTIVFAIIEIGTMYNALLDRALARFQKNMIASVSKDINADKRSGEHRQTEIDDQSETDHGGDKQIQ